MDGQGRKFAVRAAGHPEVDGVAADSLLEELKKFARRLASFGLGEETGRLLRDDRARRPARAAAVPRPGQP